MIYISENKPVNRKAKKKSRIIINILLNDIKVDVILFIASVSE